MRFSTKAWVGLGLYVATADAIAPPGETMSEGVDTWIEKHPLITLGALGAVACHLANVFEHYNLQKWDAIHHLGKIIIREELQWNDQT